MNPNLIVFFVAIPMAAGIISLPLANRPRVQRAIGTFSFLAILIMAVGMLVGIHQGLDAGDPGIFVSQMGGWEAPYGISLIFDSLSGLLIATAAMVGLGCYIHSFSTLDPAIERRYYHPVIQMLICGVNLSFLTGDLFNLFVAFEIMLMSSYVLVTIGTTRKQMTQAYKYILLNLVASTVFVITAGLTYGLMGTLNFADLARLVHEQEAAGTLPTGFKILPLMLLLVFGVKGAFFPLWFWLPDTYYTTPIAVAALFGGMLTKVGVYAVLRTFPLIFAVGEAGEVVKWLIAISAAFTMFLGVLGAVSNHEVRRILSVHVISQVGYMVFGLALMTGHALAGCLFYMIQHMVVKSALFLCCGVMEKHAGTDDLNKLGGLLKRDPFLAVLFFIAAMSLVGLPPLSGFFGKLVIIQAGWSDFWWLSVIGLATGGLTLLSMLKIWSYGFWHPDKQATQAIPATVQRLVGMRSAYIGISMLVVTALFLGFGAEVIYDLAFHAGDQLTHPQAYIEAVMGEGAWQPVTEPAMALAEVHP